MAKWHKYSEEKPENHGFYQIADGIEGCPMYPSTYCYYKKGDLIMHKEGERDPKLVQALDVFKAAGIITMDPEKTDKNISMLPEKAQKYIKTVFAKRAFEALTNDIPVRAEADGFYEVLDEKSYHELVPTYWAELPAPPEGGEWETLVDENEGEDEEE